MFTKTVLTLALFVSTALSQELSNAPPLRRAAPPPIKRSATRNTFVCGTFIHPDVKAAAEAKFSANKIAFHKPKNNIIPVHFHVIKQDDTLEGGNIPDSQIHDQMTVLNQAFAKSDLKFKLVKTNRVQNATWFAQASPFDDGLVAQTEMKRALRQGGVSTLNLYSVGFTEGTAAGGLLGYATFPSDYKSNPLDDGVVFLFSSVPGGTTVPFDLGGTVQHEVGHWVGLYHTFNEDKCEGTCDCSSDHVADTPMEMSPATGCPIGRDSCPGAPGLDPIHNYMDYSDDACYSEFTTGQIIRLTIQMAFYRGVF